jgi:DNA-binding response OmpR family regulator
VKYLEQLLIVEDDRGLNQGLSKALRADNRQIISCQDLKTAREQLLCGNVSLALLDINLPDGNGLELLREIKERTPDTPVIMLTANDTDIDIVEGLEQGADDYITKPFSLSVLRARVNTQLQKRSATPKDTTIRIDNFCFDFTSMLFYVNDTKIELSKTEQRLLYLLIENRGQVMKRGDLVDRIWTDGAEYVDENALSVTIKRLRDKLGAQKYIKTVYGIGYSWVKNDE